MLSASWHGNFLLYTHSPPPPDIWLPDTLDPARTFVQGGVEYSALLILSLIQVRLLAPATDVGPHERIQFLVAQPTLKTWFSRERRNSN